MTRFFLCGMTCWGDVPLTYAVGDHQLDGVAHHRASGVQPCARGVGNACVRCTPVTEAVTEAVTEGRGVLSSSRMASIKTYQRAHAHKVLVRRARVELEAGSGL
jgi:hypothetical protein